MAKLLSHADMRVRQASQFELAKRKNVKALANVAAGSENQLARLHGIWGVGQISRRDASANAPLLPLLKDADAEVRAQTVKVLGDAGYNAAHATVVTLLRDKSARVRAQAAIALSKLDQGAGDALIRLIAENNGNDPVVHHATILALTRHSSAGDLVKLNARKPAAIRTAAVVALRRQRSGDVATFLNDGNALVQLEAARAVADEHIDSAMPQLARLAKRTDLAKPVMRRALNANYRLANAEVLAAVAADSNQAELARAEALNLLAAWENPSGRDRITGLWRPIAKRDNSAAVAALDGKIDSILRASEGIVRSEAIATASKLKLKSAGPALLAILKDEKLVPLARPPCGRSVRLITRTCRRRRLRQHGQGLCHSQCRHPCRQGQAGRSHRQTGSHLGQGQRE